MIPTERSLASLLVLRYLQEESSEDHGVSVSDISAMLEEHGIISDRRAVYSLLNSLEEAGYDIIRTRYERKFQYYLRHDISISEAFILLSAIQENKALSPVTKKTLEQNILSLLCRNDQKLMPDTENNEKQDNNHLEEKIEVLLRTIHEKRMISFQYFDYDVHGEKTYRHGGTPYHLLPLHLLMENERYYCILYNFERNRPLNFRIDKMENITKGEIVNEPVSFDIDSYMRKTFRMFTGDAEMVTAIFDNSMASILFDTFSKENIMINHVDKDTFTASLRTSVTPTLVSWFLQFYDRVKVIRPASFIEKLTTIATTILSSYNKEKKGGTDHE